jgi:predicted esterase
MITKLTNRFQLAKQAGNFLFFTAIFLIASTAYSVSYKEKRGTYKTGIKYKGKNLSIKWAALQPKTSSKKGVLFYFHGDGGSGLNALNSLKGVVSKHDFHVVAVNTPYSSSWQGPINKRNPKHPYPNAQAFDMFLFKYLDTYKVDRNKVYFSGVSGGSMFISGHYIPKYGRNIKGGMILLCGGATSAEYLEANKAAFYTSAGFSKGFKIYHHISRDDHLFEYAEEARRDYSSLGHPYKAEWPLSGGHCGFPIFKTMKKGLDWMN